MDVCCIIAHAVLVFACSFREDICHTESYGKRSHDNPDSLKTRCARHGKRGNKSTSYKSESNMKIHGNAMKYAIG